MQNKAENTRTLMVMAAGFIAVYLVWDLQWAIFTALAITIIGSFSSYLSSLIAWIWLKLAWVLSMIIPKIILGISYYFLLFPIAVLSRMTGSKSNIIRKNDRDSFFIDVKKEFDPEHFIKPY